MLLYVRIVQYSCYCDSAGLNLFFVFSNLFVYDTACYSNT